MRPTAPSQHEPASWYPNPPPAASAAAPSPRRKDRRATRAGAYRSLGPLLLLSALVGACGGDDQGGPGGGGLTPPPDCQEPAPLAGPSLDEAMGALDEFAPGDVDSFDAFIETSYQHILRRSPESITELNLAAEMGLSADQINSQLDDRSVAYTSDTHKLYQEVLTTLQGYDRSALSATQQTSYDVYQWWLDDRLQLEAYDDYDYPVSPMSTATHRNLMLFFSEIHPLTDAASVRAYIARLRQVPLVLAQTQARLVRAESRDVVAPRFLFDVTLPGMRAVANSAPQQTQFYTRLDNQIRLLDISADERTELLAEAAVAIECHVIPGYQRLTQEVERVAQSAPSGHGVGQLSGGDDFYAQALRHHTTTDMSADDIHQRGLDQLKIIHAQMRTRFDELGYPENEPLASAFDRLAEDSGYVSGQAALDEYEAIIAAAAARLDEAFATVPAGEVVVIGGSSGGFYIPGTLDGSRPGAFYADTVNPTPRYSMASLTYHESIPGHHLQIALAQELPLPTMRQYTRFTAHVEGWALYAERLAADLGWYEDDIHGDLGRLQYQAFRAARLVVDTGIHARGWDFNQAATFLVDNVGYPRPSMEGQAIRYMAWPGQATAYEIGQSRILALREQAQEALGDEFALTDFHDAVLGHGSVPLAVLDTLVEEYIDAKQAVPAAAP